jgi:hypothetical protein
VIATLERALRINQYVGDVLDVAYLVGPAANLKQRIVARRAGIGRIEEQAVREALAPAGGQLPVLALDVVDDGGPRPAEQRRYDEAHALAAPGRGERHDVLGAVMAEISGAGAAEKDARFVEQARATNVGDRRPAGRSICCDILALARAPKRTEHSRAAPQEAASRGDRTSRVEDLRRIRIEVEPPGE